MAIRKLLLLLSGSISINNITAILIVLLSSFVTFSWTCALRKFNRESYVCVCSDVYCDSLVEVEEPFPGHVHVYESSLDGLRFHKSSIKVTPDDIFAWYNFNHGISIALLPETRYQSLNGFGGAITDAAGLNIQSLSTRLGESIIRDYFGSDGLEYSLARIPIGSAESSPRDYSLAETPNSELSNFALADEDIWYKIPVIEKARTLRPDLKLIASPWTAPTWMTNVMRARPNNAPLKGEPGGTFYKLWALYIVKFLQAYRTHGINFWALTTGNKPLMSLVPNGPEGVPMTPVQQKVFIEKDLGPLLNDSGFTPDKLKLFILDDILYIAPYWTSFVLGDPASRQYVSGIAFHWYVNHVADKNVLNFLHDTWPNQILLATEAASGTKNREEKVSLGSWKRAENYGIDIIEDLNHWATGWIESNLALDMMGGPSKAHKFQDAPIIVNAIHNEYYKQPMFYMLAHFTKFLGPGSYRVGHRVYKFVENIYILTMINHNKFIVVVLLNSNDYPVEVRIQGFSGGGYIWRTISSKAVQTYIGLL